MRRRKVLVLGHYGGCNTGDDAMLLGLIAGLGPEDRRRLAIVWKGASLPPVLEREPVEIVPAKWWRVLSAGFRSAGMVLGGGTHFQDDYSGLRYWRHCRYLARFVAISWLFRLLGRPVFWVSMGFGPLHGKAARGLTRLGLRSCDAVSVRDSGSFREIASWMRPERLHRAFDLAALLAGPPREPLRTGDPPRLGISVTSVRAARTGSWEADGLFRERLARAVCEAYAGDRTLRVRIFVMRGGSREDDLEPSRFLRERLAGVDPGRVELWGYRPDPRETLQGFRECRYFLASRFHSGVFAFLAGCPTLFLAYHRKVKDLAAEIGVPESAVLPVSPAVTASRIRLALEDLLDGSLRFRPSLPLEEAIRRARGSLGLLEEKGLFAGGTPEEARRSREGVCLPVRDGRAGA